MLFCSKVTFEGSYSYDIFAVLLLFEILMLSNITFIISFIVLMDFVVIFNVSL